MQYLGTLVGIFILTYLSFVIVGSLVAWETPYFIVTDYECIGYKVFSTIISTITAIWHGGNIIDKAMTQAKQLEWKELDEINKR